MKKGFTLLELLAVIVVLALIALIITPFITRSIEEAKKGAAEESANGVIDAAELYCATELAKNGIFAGATFTYEGEIVTKTPPSIPDLKFKGVKPTSGTVVVNEHCIVTINDLKFGDYYANGGNRTDVVITRNDETIVDPIDEEEEIIVTDDRAPGLYVTGTDEYQKIMVDDNEVDATWENIKLAYPDAFEEDMIIDFAFEFGSGSELDGDLVIGDDITTIGEHIFYELPTLTAVTLPDSVTVLGDNIFSNAHNLTTITISSSVETISTLAFENCESLTNLIVDPDNQYYASVNGILFNKSKTVLIKYPVAQSNLTYTIPARVTTINENAFAECSNLTSFTILNSSITIEEGAFVGCDSLTNINVSSPIVDLSHITFEPTENLKTINVLSPSTQIGDNAFAGWDEITEINIADSVTYIGVRAFFGCTSLISINVDAANSNYSSANGILFDKSKTTLTQYPLGKTGASYTIPNSVETIGPYSFEDCSLLKTVIIPNNMLAIGEKAFWGCTSLTSITIPSSVTTIGSEAFWGCTALTSITIPNSVTTIGPEAFLGCTALTSITIPDSVTTIGDSAFAGCTALTSAVISNSMTIIARRLFYGCNRLASVNIHSNIKTIHSMAFQDCTSFTSLTPLTIPEGVTTIDYRAFYQVPHIYYSGAANGSPWGALAIN